MFDKLYQSFRKSAKTGNVLILFLACLVFTGVVLPWANGELKSVSNGITEADLPFSYSTEQIYKIFKSYGSQGREWNTLMQLTIYAVYPLINSILVSLLILKVYGKLALKDNFIKILFLIPAVALLADYIENMCLVLMLVNYPYKLEMVSWLANVCTQAKWIFLLTSIALAIIGALLLLIKYIHFKFIVKSVPRSN
jgi:hypothetical protein